MATIHAIDAAIARAFEEPATVPCSECGAIVLADEATQVWLDGRYQPQCDVCAEEAFAEEGPEFWMDRWEDQ